MANTLVKGAIALTSLATATGSVVAYLNYGTSKEAKKDESKSESTSKLKKISKLLEKDGNKKIVEDGDTGKWTEKWTAFRDKHNQAEPTGDWAISDWTNKKVENRGLEDFKALCKTNADREVESQTIVLFTKVKEYCVA